MFNKVVECACPVCGAAIQVKGLMSVRMMCSRKGENPNKAYPASPCRGKHTRREILTALSLPGTIEKYERQGRADELDRIS